MNHIGAMAKTIVLVFVSAVLGQLVAYGTGIFDITAGEWKGIAAAGVAAVIAFLYDYLSPTDTRYGIGSE